MTDKANGVTDESSPISPAVIRKEALEEAAKVAETIFYGLSIEEWNGMTKKEHATRACLECAKAIRALQSTPHQEDKG